MEELLIRYLHFIGIILLSSMLFTENILLAKQLKNTDIKRLAVIDGVYGFAAVVTLIGGLLLWLYTGKPTAFYSANVLFHVKFSVFIVIALLSIVPTVFLLKQRNTDQALIDIPGYIIKIKRLELALLFALPLLAVLIARGIGNN